MYGYQPEDIENGLNIAQLIHPDDRGRVMGDFVQALTRKPSEFPGQHEFTALRKDGSTFPLLTYHLPIVSDDKIRGMRGIGIDLTERKKAEDALRASEKRFRDFVDLLPQSIGETDISGRMVFANKCGLKNYGYTPTDIERGVYLPELIHPDDRERVLKGFAETLTTTPSEFGNSFEFTALRKDGTTFPTLIFGLPIFDGDRVIGASSIAIDLTERKKAEDALRASEKRFRDLAELLPQNVWEADATGRVTFANTCSYGMYGYQPEDIENGLNIAQLIHPDDRGRVMGDFVQGLMRKPSEFPYQHEFTALRKDGSTFPLLIYHLPIVADDKIIGMRGIGIDLTEQKKTEETIRMSERRFRLLMDSAPLGIAFSDSKSGSICAINHEFTKIVGYEVDPVNPNMDDIFTKMYPDPEYRRKLYEIWMDDAVRLRGTNTPTDHTFNVRCGDGSDKDIRFRVVYFTDGKALTIIEDLTRPNV